MTITKDDYILRNFSKIKYKKWEYYVITRIIYLLSDPDLEFSCQQLIRTPDNKRYLTDLCFPQLGLYCEIDELQHSSEKHSLSDDFRMREIIDVSNFIEKRIKIYDKNLNILELKQIDNEIDILIKFIKQRKLELIKKGKFIKWDYYNKYNPDHYIQKGYLDINENVGFLCIRDAFRCFGYNGGHFQKAVWNIKGTTKAVWFPKLYENKDWNNSLSNDLKKIEMVKKDKSKLWEIGDHEWLVFAHSKDFLGRIIYKFIGEFHSSKEQSSLFSHIFFRKKTKIKLEEYQTI